MAAPTDARIVHRCSEPLDPGTDIEVEELGFNLHAGRASLDLVATIGERWRRAFERLRTPADLGRWAVEAGLVTTAPRVTAADLDAARTLRGAIARVAMAWGTGEPSDPDDLAVVNAAAAAPDLAPVLTRDGRRVTGGGGTIRAVCSTVARDLVDLVATGDPSRLRECAADDCSTLFHDGSRPGTRRWCSMATCGNRHKTSQYRRRRAPAR